MRGFKWGHAAIAATISLALFAPLPVAAASPLASAPTPAAEQSVAGAKPDGTLEYKVVETPKDERLSGAAVTKLAQAPEAAVPSQARALGAKSLTAATKPYGYQCDDRSGMPWLSVSRTETCRQLQLTVYTLKWSRGAKRWAGQADFIVRYTVQSHPSQSAVNVITDVWRLYWSSKGQYANQVDFTVLESQYINKLFFRDTSNSATRIPNGAWSNYSWFQATNIKKDQVRSAPVARVAIAFSVRNSNSDQPVHAENMASLRCDRVAYKDKAGCVVPKYYPTYNVGSYASGAMGEYKAHVRKALNTGLPKVLTKAPKAVADKNRAVACPSKIRRATKSPLSCDEYPFASTYQGAAKYPKNARVPYGCNYKLVKGSGAKGFSRCAINGTQNLRGGADLGNFYRRQHILDGDNYRVKA